MKTILFFGLLLTLGSCSYFYSNEYRNYYTSISSTATTVAMSPYTIASSMGYNIDFAIGTQNGYLYFGNVDDYNLKYSSTATSYSINNLTWSSFGLQIVTKYEVKVVDPSLYSWSKLSMTFSNPISNAVFGYSSSTYSILTAVSFSSRLEIFQNTTSIYNISLYEPCYSMSFNSSGDNFHFITRDSYYGDSYMYRLYIPSRTLYNTTASSSYSQNSLTFVPVDGYRHLAVSSNYYSIIQWNNYSSYSTSTSQTYSKIKFTSDGENLVGSYGYNSYSIGIIGVNLNYTYFVDSYTSQNMYIDNPVVDFDTKRSYILVLTSSQNLAIISTSNITTKHTWIIIVGCVFGFLLIVGIAGAIAKRRQMRRQQQNGAYIQQDDIAHPVVPSNYNYPPANYDPNQQNQGFINQGYNNQGFNNQGPINYYENNAYKPPQ